MLMLNLNYYRYYFMHNNKLQDKHKYIKIRKLIRSFNIIICFRAIN